MFLLKLVFLIRRVCLSECVIGSAGELSTSGGGDCDDCSSKIQNREYLLVNQCS